MSSCYCSLAVQLCLTLVALWTVARQAPRSMGFSRQQYWSGLSFPPPGDLLYPGTEPKSSALEGGYFTAEPPGKPPMSYRILIYFNIVIIMHKHKINIMNYYKFIIISH